MGTYINILVKNPVQADQVEHYMAQRGWIFRKHSPSHFKVASVEEITDKDIVNLVSVVDFSGHGFKDRALRVTQKDASEKAKAHFRKHGTHLTP